VEDDVVVLYDEDDDDEIVSKPQKNLLPTRRLSISKSPLNDHQNGSTRTPPTLKSDKLFPRKGGDTKPTSCNSSKNSPTPPGRQTDSKDQHSSSEISKEVPGYVSNHEASINDIIADDKLQRPKKYELRGNAKEDSRRSKSVSLDSQDNSGAGEDRHSTHDDSNVDDSKVDHPAASMMDESRSNNTLQSGKHQNRNDGRDSFNRSDKNDDFRGNGYKKDRRSNDRKDYVNADYRGRPEPRDDPSENATAKEYYRKSFDRESQYDNRTPKDRDSRFDNRGREKDQLWPASDRSFHNAEYSEKDVSSNRKRARSREADYLKNEPHVNDKDEFKRRKSSGSNRNNHDIYKPAPRNSIPFDQKRPSVNIKSKTQSPRNLAPRATEDIAHRMQVDEGHPPPQAAISEISPKNELSNLEELIAVGGYNLEAATVLVQSLKMQDIIPEPHIFRNLIAESIQQRNACHVESFLHSFHKYSAPNSVSSTDYISAITFYISSGYEPKLFSLFEFVGSLGVLLSGNEWESLWWAAEPLIKTRRVVQILVDAMERQYSREDADILDMMDSVTLDLAMSEAVSHNLISHALSLFRVFEKYATATDEPVSSLSMFSSVVLEDFVKGLVYVNYMQPAYATLKFCHDQGIVLSDSLLSFLFESVCRAGNEMFIDDVYDLLVLKSALSLRDIEPLFKYIRILVENSRLADVFQILKDLKRFRIPIRVGGWKHLEFLLSAAVENTMVEEFTVIITSMVAPSDKRALLVLDGSFCMDLILACINEKVVGHAIWLYKYMQVKDLPRTPSFYSGIFSSLARVKTEGIPLSLDILAIYRDALKSGYSLGPADTGAIVQVLYAERNKNLGAIMEEFSTSKIGYSGIPTLILMDITCFDDRDETAIQMVDYYTRFGYVPLIHMRRFNFESSAEDPPKFLTSIFKHLTKEKQWGILERLVQDFRKYAEYIPTRLFTNKSIQPLSIREGEACCRFALRLFCFFNEASNTHGGGLHKEVMGGCIAASDTWSLLHAKFAVLRHLEYLHLKITRGNASMPSNLKIFVPKVIHSDDLRGRSVALELMDILQNGMNPPLKCLGVEENDRSCWYIRVGRPDFQFWLNAFDRFPNPMQILRLDDKFENGTLIADLTQVRSQQAAPQASKRRTSNRARSPLPMSPALVAPAPSDNSEKSRDNQKEVFERILILVKKIMFDLELNNLPKDQFKTLSRHYTKGLMAQNDSVLRFSRERMPHDVELLKIIREHINAARSTIRRDY